MSMRNFHLWIITGLPGTGKTALRYCAARTKASAAPDYSAARNMPATAPFISWIGRLPAIRSSICRESGMYIV